MVLIKMSKSVILKLFKLVNIKLYDEYPQNYDIQIIDETVYQDLLTYKTLGFGEAYITGKFMTPNLELLLQELQKINTLSIWTLLQFLQLQDYLYFIGYIFWKFLI